MSSQQRQGQRLLNGAPPPVSMDDNWWSIRSAVRRSRDDRWIGGVCGGLARVTDMDSWIWRLVFALFTFSFGIGLVIYILLWMFVPQDDLIGN
ncbi:MAG: PspC domain-containing protein [Aquabacterium sp.]